MEFNRVERQKMQRAYTIYNHWRLLTRIENTYSHVDEIRVRLCVFYST